jgi:hypothetical protein
MDAKVNALQVIRGIAQPTQEVLAIIGECRRKLAMDFDTPAQQIIAIHATKLGLNTKQFNTLCEKISGAQI